MNLAALVGSSIVNSRRIPSSADIRRHLPLWEGFWVPQKTNTQPQPPDCQLQTTLVILSVPTFSPQLEQYNRVRGNSVLATRHGRA